MKDLRNRSEIKVNLNKSANHERLWQRCCLLFLDMFNWTFDLILEEEVGRNECHAMISFHIKDTLNKTVSNTSLAELLSLHKKM